MGGAFVTVMAKTEAQLESSVEEFLARADKAGLGEVRTKEYFKPGELQKMYPEDESIQELPADQHICTIWVHS